MFDRLKFTASAMMGLLIGACLAAPLFWIGVKKGVGRLHDSAVASFKAVDDRQQNMSDEALRLEMSLKRLKAKAPRADFAKVERLRSELAGSGDFEDKVEISQELDRALVNIESIYKQAMQRDARVAASPYCRDFGLNWQPMKRYLADEEYRFVGEVKSYNGVLQTPPVPLIVGYKSFGALLAALPRMVKNSVMLYLRQAWAWIKFGWNWVVAKVKGESSPPKPEALPPYEFKADSLYAPLPVPFYVTQAAVPEEDYPELQYDREAPNMADVEVGQQKAQLDSPGAEPFAAPVPTVQKTAGYR